MTSRLELYLITLLSLTFLPVAATSQDLAGLSICIDPGHGAGNANQGPTGLREANIDLDVSLFLKEFLKSANIDTVLLTRIDDSTNPSLSQREAVANSFGVDWFHSVHHNACGGVGAACTARSTILLLEEVRTSTNPCASGSRRGTGVPEWPGEADVMSNNMAQRIFEALRTTSRSTRLDWTFYGSCNGGFSLGVLNDLQMPGELSEATFHQNRIEENKLRNADFLKLEARALYMAILDFYDAGTLTTGTLAGTITSQENGLPVNGARVVLNQGMSTYTVDENDNGFFAFHDLLPGTYVVTVSAEGLATETRTGQVFAHAFRFLNFSLESGLPPVITDTLPVNQSQNVDVYKEIGVRFSRSMNRQSVEDAFNTVPPAEGHFIWNNNSDILFFEPDVRFDFETEYEARVAASATGVDGQALDGNGDGTAGDAFSFSFTTAALDEGRPVILDFFPSQRDTAVFVRDVFRAQFNRELDPSSVNETSVKLTPSGGADVALRIEYLGDGSRLVTLAPTEPLQPGLRHFLTFTSGITLEDGSPLSRNFIRQFTTHTNPVVIDYLDDFEAGLAWGAPNDSPNTFGIVPDSTFFRLTEVRQLSEATSAEFSYKISGPTGFAQVDRLDHLKVTIDEGTEIGIYVFGDSSENQIRLLLRDVDGDEALPWTTINWSGWRLLRFNLLETTLEAGSNGNGFFDAGQVTVAAIQLNIDARAKGRLFLDDLIQVVPENPVSVPSFDPPAAQPRTFVLSQNYPNPFNPDTLIKYEISGLSSRLSRVALEVFNLQGQKVRTLVNTEQPTGVYSVAWDGLDETGRVVSTGVYVYKLRVGSRTASKKMLFLK